MMPDIVHLIGFVVFLLVASCITMVFMEYLEGERIEHD